ncbi:hypothetical protein [uncultured Lamprocystis sp.]|jgi:adenine-specific DNA-methyltransferase|uniref:hypothetical protein n=1 Tax=uncultured Lamprocystis sp. TaxID=543132 RepID=UPI0025F9410B|nr:hypothetical protein [uncultured Lamprocystis sp.]
MAHLENKIAEIADPHLREIIDEEVKKLKEEKQFGLVFEGHQPEVVPVLKAAVRKGAIVAKRGGNLAETWHVMRVHDDAADILRDTDESRETVSLASLVVVRRMGEPVFPAPCTAEQCPKHRSARAASHPDLGRELSRAATAGLSLYRQGGLHLYLL